MIEERFHRVFETPIVAIGIYAAKDKKWIEINDTICELFGYSRAEMFEMTWIDITHPDDIEANLKLFDAAMAGDEQNSYSMDKRFIHKDGKIVFTSIQVDCVRTLDGIPDYFILYIENITESNKSEVRLLENLDLTEKIIAKSPFGISTFRADGQCVSANQAMADIIGGTIDQCMNMNFNDIESWENSGILDDALRSISTGEFSHRNVNLKTSFDKNVNLDYYIIPFTTEGEIHLLLMLQDITERMEAENAIVEAKNAAEIANQAKSDFLSSMSHELRTPMNAILGFGQLLENNPKESLSEAQQDHVEQILKGGDHLLDLIDQVLELSKIEAGNISLSIESVSPEDVINESFKMVQSQAQEKDIELEFPPPDIELPPIKTDKNRFRQILLNLLSNAIKYNRAGGKVTVASEYMEKDHLRISTTDTGLGIPENKQNNIYEPFNRLGREAGEIEGTGIGLTITKQIVELMGGKIGFASEEGVGSTFWFELPVSDEQTIPADNIVVVETNDGVAENDVEASGTILYIEDNPANLRLMEAIIDRLPDLTMMSAHNAELGLNMASDFIPDLILMDINLPGMDGIAALRKLREKTTTKDIPVIAISAAAMPNEIERGREADIQ